jgi:hypothetical protein
MARTRAKADKDEIVTVAEVMSRSREAAEAAMASASRGGMPPEGIEGVLALRGRPSG